jgi:hypothetical protein
VKAWETSKVWQEQEQCDVAIQMVIRCVDRDVKEWEGRGWGREEEKRKEGGGEVGRIKGKGGGGRERIGVRTCHNTRVGVHVLFW